MEHLDQRESMKFVINGRSFDTASSSPAAISRGVIASDFDSYDKGQWVGAEQVRFEYTLFRTPKGNFWTHDHTTIKFPKGKPVIEDTASEVTPEDAVKWVVQNGAAIVDGTGLPLPEDA